MKKVIALLVLLAVVGAGCYGLGSGFSTEGKTTKLKFEDIGELATQTAYCTEVKTIEADRKLWGHHIPFTGSKSIVSYDIVIKAGFNAEEITWEEADKTIQIQMPKPEILSCSVVDGSLKVYLEEESVFRKVKWEEQDSAVAEMKKEARKDALANGLMDNAKENAEVILRGFVGQVYDLEEYEVQFTYAK